MEIYLCVALFILGAIVGSFLNVLIYRLHTGKSLGGRSHCMSCGTELAWFELFPLLSYLSLRGACRTCASYIPSRYFLVELITALLFLLVWIFFSTDVVLIALYLILVSLFVVILVYDIRHMIIPDELTVGVLGVGVLYMLYEYSLRGDMSLVLERCIGAVAVSLFFAGLWFVSKGRWIGLGDAKLAFPLGLMTIGSGAFTMVVLSFWVGAGISLVLLALQKLMKKWTTHLRFLGTPLTIKSEVPFAPFLIIAFLLVQFFHANIFEFIHKLFV